MTNSVGPVPAKKSSKLKGCLLWGGGIFIGLGVVGALTGPPPDRKDRNESVNSRDVTVEDSAVARPDVSATEIIRAYKANEIAAEKKYGELPMRVGGVVLSVQADLLGDPLISIGSTGDFMGASVSLDEDHSEFASRLRKGQTVVFLCDGATEVIGVPQLKNCVPE